MRLKHLDKWGITRRRAYQLLDAAGAAENLCTNIPTNERQIRPLTRLEPEFQREAWEKALANPTSEINSVVG